MSLEIEIEDIDIKIIKDLLENGRKSFDTIAKECCVSSTTIGKHYKKLEDAGIIVGATIQVNWPAVSSINLATILLTVESQDTEQVIERLLKIPNTYVKRQYNIDYNILVMARWKTPRDLDIIKENIKRNNPIIECKTYIWTDVRNTPENLSLGHVDNIDKIKVQNRKKLNLAPKFNSVVIDEIDLKIIDKLLVNGREPLMKIAQELGISTDTVSRRYTKLVKNNLIKSSIQINPKKLGYNAIADFRLAFTTQEETNLIIDSLMQIPNVSYIVKVEGDFDLHVVALARDLDQIFSINEQISKLPHIKKQEVALRKPLDAWPGPGQYISTINNTIEE